MPKCVQIMKLRSIFRLLAGKQAKLSYTRCLSVSDTGPQHERQEARRAFAGSTSINEVSTRCLCLHQERRSLVLSVPRAATGKAQMMMTQGLQAATCFEPSDARGKERMLIYRTNSCDRVACQSKSQLLSPEAQLRSSEYLLRHLLITVAHCRASPSAAVHSKQPSFDLISTCRQSLQP